MDHADIKQQLLSLDKRLAKIEAALNIQQPKPTAAPAVTQHAYVEHTAVKPMKAQPAYVEKNTSEEPKSGNWLGIIAMVCFVIAAGFIVKLSIDSGWLTPTRQIGIVTLFGFSLIGAGFMFLQSDRAYASLLPGGGIIVLYLTSFAAHRYYGIIDFHAALFCTTLVSALCVGLYTQIRHDIYPVTAAIGAYLAPVVLDMHAMSLFSIYYFIPCSFAFALISLWLRSRILTMVASYLAIIITAFIGDFLHEDWLIMGALALHFLTFSIGTYYHSVYTQTPLTPAEALRFLPVLVIFYAAEYHLINQLLPGLAPWISLGFAGVLIGLYIATKHGSQSEHLGGLYLVTAFTTLVGFHSVYMNLLPDMLQPLLVPVILVAAAFVPISVASAMESPWKIPAIALAAIVVIEYVHMVQYPHGFYWFITAAASVAGIWFLFINKREKLSEHETISYGLLGAGHVLAVVALYQLTENIGSLAISASWLIYAIAVMVFASIRTDRMMARSALPVLMLAAGKALLYDASSAPTIIRIACLMLTGAVLYGAGLFMRKIDGWKTI